MKGIINKTNTEITTLEKLAIGFTDEMAEKLKLI